MRAALSAFAFLLLLSCRGEDKKADTSGDGGDGSDTEDSGTIVDADEDGYAEEDDCDDNDPSIHPGAPETDCTDPTDYNCDGSTGYEDADEDGVAACEDCDDTDASMLPGAEELCDGLDNDCDGTIDDGAGDSRTFYGDADEDGFGGTLFQETACAAPEGFVENADDCNDLSASSNPDAEEICDEADNDCDGDVDEGVQRTFYADQDHDGFGDVSAPTGACTAPIDHVSNALDCDDTDARTNPSSYEICDGLDNDCDGSTDDASAINAQTFYVDSDGDGYGTLSATTRGCSQPSGYADNAQDCDDGESAVSPAASELCDTIDNDCDGTTDEADATDALDWYTDADGDGHGDPAELTVACSAPSGTVESGDDCDDADLAISPSATEVCNEGTDDDCDGLADDDDVSLDGSTTSTWYPDDDGDGYGDPDGISVEACAEPSGYTDNGDDCDDTTSSYTTNCADGTSQSNAGITCASILADHPSSTDGTYWIDIDGDTDHTDAVAVYCDMSNGGWAYASSGTPFTIGYTGGTQTLVTAAVSTEYRFAVYGAAAGRGRNTLGTGTCGTGSLTGGYGGSATGSRTFSASTTLYVEVGGQGDDGGCADQGSYNTQVGGYNGGGRGSQGGSAGGGATDIRTVSGDLSSRILVGGGGGGCGYESCYYGGGAGGGLTGGLGTGCASTAASQSGGGTSCTGSGNGSLGQGGDNTQGNDEGGGGGGYYGGAAGGNANTSGGGGSSYYGGMTSDLSTSSGVNSGDGYVEYIFH